MLAYRHAFHAGNHADVLKHLVLTHVLRHMSEKDKPYRCVDTHAGAGGYSLQGRYAQKKAEYENGIGRLWDARRPAARRWPTTSRWCARSTRRRARRSTRARRRSRRCCCARRTSCACSSCTRPIPHPRVVPRPARAPRSRRRRLRGLKGAAAAAVAARRRADRPELRGQADYAQRRRRAARSAGALRRRRLHGLVPQVQLVEAAQLPRRLAALRAEGWLHARLTVQEPDAQGFGLAGSGVFVINPPHTLHASWRGRCRSWSTCSASTTAPTS